MLLFTRNHQANKVSFHRFVTIYIVCPLSPLVFTLLTLDNVKMLACTFFVNSCEHVLQDLFARDIDGCMDVKEMARMGGLARAAAMTAKQRSESARKAGKAGKGKPKPRHPRDRCS